MVRLDQLPERSRHPDSNLVLVDIEVLVEAIDAIEQQVRGLFCHVTEDAGRRVPGRRRVTLRRKCVEVVLEGVDDRADCSAGVRVLLEQCDGV
ncbi:hypothetical protein [Natronoarchaeum rubrum]|uniref:hypothetical protein n=1 Tax=Natronoarchaeum rubrum TaxID=755311 RepID=UPI002111F7AA|nr:hypothetical protein [Natronoarchaeum rubrum]